MGPQNFREPPEDVLRDNQYYNSWGRWGIMNPNQYQQLALEKEADQTLLTRHVYVTGGTRGTALTNGIIGLTDECGELAALRKRWLEHRGLPPQPHEILEECGDVLWRTCQILNAFGLTLEQAMEANIEKLHKIRYRDGKVCNPHDANEANSDRVKEAIAVRKVIPEKVEQGVEKEYKKAGEALGRRANTEDDGANYG